MKKDTIIYQIKSLDKSIFRYLTSDICFHNKVMPTPTQMQIIDYILNHLDEDIYQRDLENVLNLRRATVSGVLQTMEKNGLIERIVSSSDTRVKKIILRPSARKIYDEKLKMMKELEKRMINGISKDEIDAFYQIIDKMKKNIRNNHENHE